MRALPAFALVAAVTSLAAAAPDRRPAVLEVNAGAHSRRATPIVVPLPERWRNENSVRLVATDDQQEVPAQRLDRPEPTLVWILEKPLSAGTSRRYRLEADAPAVSQARARCEDDGEALILRVNDRPVLRYHHATLEPPPGIDPVYGRSGFIHPLYTPLGRVVTDDFPPDHAHQHGLFFAWVNTTFRGHRVDFWNQNERTGRVRHNRVIETSGGPVFAEFQVELVHEDITQPDHPVAALTETWSVRAYNGASYHLVDFVSHQECAGPDRLTLNQYHYGGFGFRGQRAWFDPAAEGENPPSPERSGESDFLTSEGRHRLDGNHSRPRWIDLSGLVDGKPAGAAVLGNPENARAPQPVRLHPNKPYFSIAPVVLGPFTIEPGRPYLSRYRIVLHDGSPGRAELDRLWDDYAEPPRVVWVDSP